MNLFLLVIFLFNTQASLSQSSEDSSSSEVSHKYPEIDAYQLLSDVREAIHNKNQFALKELLTSEIAGPAVRDCVRIRLPNIPVKKIIEVTNVVMELPNVTFIAKIGNNTQNCSALYFEEKKQFLLNHEDCFVAIIDLIDLHESLRLDTNNRCSILLEHIIDAIRNKNLTLFMNSVTPTAKFITRENETKTADKMFEEITKISGYIPFNDRILTTYRTTHLSSDTFTHEGLAGGEYVKFIFKYSRNHTKWLLDEDVGGVYYTSLIDHAGLEKVTAYNTMFRLYDALRLLSPRRLREVTADEFEKSVNNSDIPNELLFRHYVKYTDAYSLYFRFNLTNIISNFGAGAMRYRIENNNNDLNWMEIMRKNGTWKFVDDLRMPCIKYSNPNLKTPELKSRLNAMIAAEKLLDHYMSTKRDVSTLFTDSYTLANGTTVQNQFLVKNENVADLYVMSVNYDKDALKSFRAETIYRSEKEKKEFKVETSLYGHRKLTSEAKY